MESRAARLARERFRRWRVRPEAADGDDRVVEGVSDASGAASRRAAAWIRVPRSGSQAPDGGAVRRRDRRDHRRLECVSASGATQAAGTAAAGPPPGRYTREWQTPASSLARALGRPIRDQVFSTRNTAATTIQALELVNGERLANWLLRGARNMLGELPAPPTALFVTPINSRGGRAATPPQSRTAPAPFDVDISGAPRLWLIVQDANSTAVDKAEAVWARGELVGPNGAVTPLTVLTPLDESALRAASGPVVLDDATFASGVRVKTPSRLVYDISGRGFTRLRGVAGLENVSALAQGETILGRFLIFGTEPDMDRLVPPTPGTPLPPGPRLTTRDTGCRPGVPVRARTRAICRRADDRTGRVDRFDSPRPHIRRRARRLVVGCADEARVPADFLRTLS